MKRSPIPKAENLVVESGHYENSLRIGMSIEYTIKCLGPLEPGDHGIPPTLNITAHPHWNRKWTFTNNELLQLTRSNKLNQLTLIYNRPSSFTHSHTYSQCPQRNPFKKSSMTLLILPSNSWERDPSLAIWSSKGFSFDLKWARNLASYSVMRSTGTLSRYYTSTTPESGGNYALDTRINKWNLFLNRERSVLPLF